MEDSAGTASLELPFTADDSQSVHRRHVLTPEAGHALEILGHAIEYLTDELVHESGSPLEDNGRLQAIRMLMALNRQIYFACPVAQSFGERLTSMGSHFIPHRR